MREEKLVRPLACLTLAFGSTFLRVQQKTFEEARRRSESREDQLQQTLASVVGILGAFAGKLDSGAGGGGANQKATSSTNKDRDEGSDRVDKAACELAAPNRRLAQKFR